MNLTGQNIQIMNEQDECPICVDAKPAVRVDPCGHTFCLACILRCNPCPLCRGECKYLCYNVKVQSPTQTRLELAKLYPPGNLYPAIKQLVRGANAKKVAGQIAAMVAEVGGWLTVAQANKLLARAEKHGILEFPVRSTIVQLCHLPWDVDLKLGCDGLCYYGYNGDPPPLYTAIGMLKEREKNRISPYPRRSLTE